VEDIYVIIIEIV